MVLLCVLNVRLACPLCVCTLHCYRTRGRDCSIGLFAVFLRGCSILGKVSLRLKSADKIINDVARIDPCIFLLDHDKRVFCPYEQKSIQSVIECREIFSVGKCMRASKVSLSILICCQRRDEHVKDATVTKTTQDMQFSFLNIILCGQK